jgi:hypothetical protein
MVRFEISDSYAFVTVCPLNFAMWLPRPQPTEALDHAKRSRNKTVRWGEQGRLYAGCLTVLGLIAPSRWILDDIRHPGTRYDPPAQSVRPASAAAASSEHRRTHR